MNRIIKKVAVLGSGVMGSRIACHFANIGVQVMLLDIVPMQLTDDEKKNPTLRNKLVNDSLQAAIKQNPSPVYAQKVIKQITTGNFDDDLQKIKDVDWIVEVVIENLEIKQQLFEKVDALRKPGTLVTSNTSGIPIHQMIIGRSDDFKQHFCGTHFFNPPRYLKLLEIIPTP
ncbi:MAG: 3-hydroxyacyl-CoA dehydrogenase family protein, partial [Chitinophagales bacterium]